MANLVVDISTTKAWSYISEHEIAAEALQSAIDSTIKSIARCEELIRERPQDGDYWYNRLAECQAADFRIMGENEYWQCKDAIYRSKPLHEISAERYNEMFDVLPPLKWCTIRGVTMFCISEMYEGSWTNQFAKCNGKYYEKLVDICDKSTWIYNFIGGTL